MFSYVQIIDDQRYPECLNENGIDYSGDVNNTHMGCVGVDKGNIPNPT